VSSFKDVNGYPLSAYPLTKKKPIGHSYKHEYGHHIVSAGSSETESKIVCPYLNIHLPIKSTWQVGIIRIHIYNESNLGFPFPFSFSPKRPPPFGPFSPCHPVSRSGPCLPPPQHEGHPHHTAILRVKGTRAPPSFSPWTPPSRSGCMATAALSPCDAVGPANLLCIRRV
jgi:hypothetical protein